MERVPAMGRKKRRQPDPQQQSLSTSVEVEGKLQQAVSLIKQVSYSKRNEYVNKC